MGVTIAEKDGVTWFEFPGRAKGERRTSTYRMTVKNRMCQFDRGSVEPPFESELALSKAVFKRAVSSLQDADRSVVSTKNDGFGTVARFEAEGNTVTFTLPCDEKHVFNKEDLLILADQI